MAERGTPTEEAVLRIEALNAAIKGFNQQITTAFGGHDFRHINTTVSRYWELKKGEWIYEPTYVTTGLMDMDALDAVRVYVGPSDTSLEFGHLIKPDNSRRPGEAGPYIDLRRRIQYVGRDKSYDSSDLEAIEGAKDLMDLALKHQPSPLPKRENPNPDEKNPEAHQVVRDMVERVFAGLGRDRFTFINASLKSGVFIRLEDNERDNLAGWGYGHELKIEKYSTGHGDTVLKIPGLNPYRSEPIPVIPWFSFRAPGYRSPIERETEDPEAVRRVYEFLDEVLPIHKAA